MCGDTDPKRDHQGRRPKPKHITVGSGEAAMRPEWKQTVICTAARSGPDSRITDCLGVTQTGSRRYPSSLFEVYIFAPRFAHKSDFS